MNWTDIEEIAESLAEKYPSEDVMSLRFVKLREYILGLEDFSDDANRCNEKILEAVQAEWFELIDVEK